MGFCDFSGTSGCVDRETDFQYSLRIVGFCDRTSFGVAKLCAELSVFPANRGVLRPRAQVSASMSGTSIFQYFLRIVGFCDSRKGVERQANTTLSVFPANRGVLRPYNNCTIGGSC